MIHVQVEKYEKTGIILGTQIDISVTQLSFDIFCFIRNFFKSAIYYHIALKN